MPSSRAVPPVETSSTPNSSSPRPKSTSPRLSDTVKSARRRWTSPGAAGSAPLCSVVFAIDQNEPWVVWVETQPARGDQPHSLRKQPVLNPVYALLDLRDVGRVGKLERFLQDDRHAVDPLVDEVDRHPHHLE